VIRPKWLREVREILRDGSFQAWFARYRELRLAIEASTERHDHLVEAAGIAGYRSEITQRTGDDTLYRVGALEDLVAHASSDQARTDNDSFDQLHAFEEQRNRARAVWEETLRIEGPIEDKRREASDLRAELVAARKGGRQTRDTVTLEARLRMLEAEITTLARELEPIRIELQRAEAIRDELWRQEETSWSTGLRASLARAEYGFQVRRLQRKAEASFARALEERRKVETLGAEARVELERRKALERQLEEHRSRGEAALECALIEEFIYWPQQEDLQKVYCVPLVDQPDFLSIPLTFLCIYELDKELGLDAVSPVHQAAHEDDDPRLTEFFLVGRPQAPRIPAPSVVRNGSSTAPGY
jgi:hypothetical protein